MKTSLNKSTYRTRGTQQVESLINFFNHKYLYGTKTSEQTSPIIQFASPTITIAMFA